MSNHFQLLEDETGGQLAEEELQGTPCNREQEAEHQSTKKKRRVVFVGDSLLRTYILYIHTVHTHCTHTHTHARTHARKEEEPEPKPSILDTKTPKAYTVAQYL